MRSSDWSSDVCSSDLLGLGLYRLIRRAPRVRLNRGEVWPLIGAVFFGGLLGPVLLMLGLANMPASGASLLLNVEGVFTALLAWFVRSEERRVGKSVSVRVDLGGRRNIKKNTTS